MAVKCAPATPYSRANFRRPATASSPVSKTRRKVLTSRSPRSSAFIRRSPPAAAHPRLAQYVEENREGAERADQQQRPPDCAPRPPVEPVAHQERDSGAQHAARAGDKTDF